MHWGFNICLWRNFLLFLMRLLLSLIFSLCKNFLMKTKRDFPFETIKSTISHLESSKRTTLIYCKSLNQTSNKLWSLTIRNRKAYLSAWCISSDHDKNKSTIQELILTLLNFFFATVKTDSESQKIKYSNTELISWNETIMLTETGKTHLKKYTN